MRGGFRSIDPRIVQAVVETFLAIAILVSPVALSIKIVVILAASTVSNLFLRGKRSFDSRYVRSLEAKLSHKDEIIRTQGEIISETRESYQALQKKLKKALITIQLKDLKERHKRE